MDLRAEQEEAETNSQFKKTKTNFGYEKREQMAHWDSYAFAWAIGSSEFL